MYDLSVEKLWSLYYLVFGIPEFKEAVAVSNE